MSRLPTQYFSPKTVALAIGVSESSLKRWCDKGKILAIKTAGGHRRLAGADIVEFLRAQQIPLQNPEIMGFPARSAYNIRSTQDAQDQLFSLLKSGQEVGCRDLMIYSVCQLVAAGNYRR